MNSFIYSDVLILKKNAYIYNNDSLLGDYTFFVVNFYPKQLITMIIVYVENGGVCDVYGDLIIVAYWLLPNMISISILSLRHHTSLPQVVIISLQASTLRSLWSGLICSWYQRMVPYCICLLLYHVFPVDTS